jgi:ribonucleotide reductase alpha subunit
MSKFSISSSFIDKYRDKHVEWGFNGLGYIAYKRTYAREKTDGTQEEWFETCRRVVEGTYNMQKDHIERHGLGWNPWKAQYSAQEMYDRMFHFKWLPPGRGIWAMGSAITEEKGLYMALNNCFTGDTKISTEIGCVALGDVSGMSVNVVAGDGEYRPAEVRSFGVQDVNSVTFKSHGNRSNLELSYRVTANHRWYLSDGTVTTDLQVGDRVQFVAPRVMRLDPTGFAHGLVFGDGTRHTYYPERHLVKVCDGFSHHYEPLLVEADGYQNKNTGGADGYPVYNFIVRGPSWKDLPAGKSPEYIASFIEGWLDADASASPSGSRVLATQNREAADWLIEHAHYAGYAPVGISYDNRETNFGARSATLNKVVLRNNNIPDFVVSAIEPAGREEVFCATEPVTSSFVLAGGLKTGNCAFTSTETIASDLTKPFEFLMDASMLGVGVGFDTKGAGKIVIHEPEECGCKFVIPDTREGWVESVKALLSAFFEGGNMPVFDYSEIRGPGEPIKGFGGISSGPAPLIELHERLTALLTDAIGQPITSRHIVDIMNMIGKCVVSGNVRRSAEIAFGEVDDDTFLDLKNYDENPERAEYGWTSNNSVFATVGMDYTEIAKRIAVNGEPGVAWLHNMQAYSRMGDPADWKDRRAKGGNPCQPGWAHLLTKSGIRPMDEICIGESIWNGTQWVQVTNKWATGIKPVYRYRTIAGVFYGTENHRVVSGGNKIEVKDADSIDIAVGPFTAFDFFDYQSVVDGLVVGDGTLNTRTRGREVLLCVGDNDQDYFKDPVSDLIGEPKAWEGKSFDVTTTIEPEELPVTWERTVPSRFLYGDVQARVSFLRGLYSANGSICGNRVALKATSELLVEQVQEMLSSLGIASYITTNKASEIEWRNGTYTSRQSYDVNIGTDREEFRRLIGFIQGYKNEALNRICRVGKGRGKTTFDIQSAEYVGDHMVYDITVDTRPNVYWTGGMLVSNCLEQTLEPYEVCCLVETFPDKHESYEDYEKTLKYAYLYAKTVTLGKTHWPETNRVMLRNRRIGTSMSGIAQFLASRGIDELKDWCEEGYDYIQGLDDTYSDWMAVPKSIKTTSVKPSGTVSLLAGATPGLHFPESRYYIRRMRLPLNSSLIDKLEAANYNVEPAVEGNAMIVEVPVTVGDNVKTLAEVSIWEQFAVAAMMQRYWADNQVSCTVTFDPETEADQIATVLQHYQYSLKGISLLPRLEGGAYEQMPYEEIDEGLYLDMVSRLDYLDLSEASDSAVPDKYCDGDYCEVV